MIRENFIETLVGATVIVIAIAFFVYAYQSAGLGTGSGGYRIEARFDRIEGVKVGTDVRMSGIKIGSVVGQELDNETFEAVVTMALSPNVKVPEDSTAKITSEGLLGGTYVLIEPGGSLDNLQEGGQISYTQSAVNVFDLIGKFLFSGDGGDSAGGATSGGAASGEAAPDGAGTGASGADAGTANAGDTPTGDTPTGDTPTEDAPADGGQKADGN